MPTARCGPIHVGIYPSYLTRGSIAARRTTLLAMTFDIDQGDAEMGDKGSKDKGKREKQKKAQRSPKEKRKLQREKKEKS